MQNSHELPAWNHDRLPMVAIALAGALAAASSLAAHTNQPKPQELPARVLAHIPLATPAGNEMVLQNQGENRYLYIQTATKDGFMVVDVRKPEFPSLLDRQVKGNDPTAGNLQVVGSDLGVASVPDQNSKGSLIRSSGSNTQTVRILDLSDPAHPKTIQTFKNVTGMVGDAGRGILYLANDEGLWVLKHERHLLAPGKEKKPCDSSTAIAAMPPDCQ
jgi:hypothetical protein